ATSVMSRALSSAGSGRWDGGSPDASGSVSSGAAVAEAAASSSYGSTGSFSMSTALISIVSAPDPPSGVVCVVAPSTRGSLSFGAAMGGCSGTGPPTTDRSGGAIVPPTGVSANGGCATAVSVLAWEGGGCITTTGGGLARFPVVSPPPTPPVGDWPG